MKKISSLLIFLSFFPQTLLFAKDYIGNSVGLYISREGQSYFQDHLDDLIARNGISIDEFYYEKITASTAPSSLEEMMENGPLKETIIKLRDAVGRFFTGFEINPKHKFEFTVNDLEFKVQWKKMGVSFAPQIFDERNPRSGILMHLQFIAENIRLSAEEAKGLDLNNDFLGTYGFRKFSMIQTDEGQPLMLSFPIKMSVTPFGAVDLEVISPIINLQDINFATDFASPLIFPKLEVTINGRTGTLNLNEIEEMLRADKDELVKVIQSQLQEWAQTTLPPELTKFLNQKLSQGLTEANEMNPPGAPANQPAKKFLWWLRLAQIGFSGDALRVFLAGAVEDPDSAVPLPAPETALELPNVESSVPYDIAITLNQGLINRILQLSFNRGYFSNMQAGTEKINLVRPPVLRLKKSPTLSLRMKYTVTGFASAFVRNPIELDFDLKLAFPIKNAKIQMVVESIDLDSIHLEDKYIRMFKTKVRKALKDKMAEISKTMSGFVLAEELPAPTSLVGIPMTISSVVTDRNGHLVIYMNYHFQH